MSIWMELRCDGRGESRKKNPCFSDNNIGPMENLGNSKAYLAAGHAEIVHQATSSGWKLIKGEWYCPACVADMEQSQS